VQVTSGAISGTATVNVAAGPLASIAVSPDPASLATGASQQFIAVGRDASGNVVAISPTWSVVNPAAGTINSAGLFVAGTVAGAYTNSVRATSGGIVGAATVNVLAGPLASIIVSPDPVSVPSGLAQQFTAVGRDASGNVVSITPTWTIVNSGGTISGTGLFTAGTTPGTFTNTVRATSGAIAGFASVNVTVNLGTAAPFAVLGGSGASSCAGVSSVAGNVGVSPGGTISGFPVPCVIAAPGDGVVHLNDSAAATAQADMTAANTSLSSLACTMDLSGQDLGGKSLAPGVYCFTSSAQLTGAVTLTGPSTGLWIFRISSTLTTATGSSVGLSGGAQAANVFWQVGTSATIGATNNSFQGNILANASITLGAGTSLTGRALAKVTVIMDTNAVILP